MKSYMQATMERDRQKAEKAELDRLRAVNKELVEALESLQREVKNAVKFDVKKHYSLMVADVTASKTLAKAKEE